MVKDIITYLNAKINTVGYFDTSYCLVDKIKKGDKLYPAIYNGANEYQDIVLDDNLGSISYWRKSGDVTITDQDNQTTANGVQYNMTIPLKLVCFVKKENNDTNDQYFADNLCASLIANLTTNTSALKTAMKAKKVSIIADRYVTDSRAVIADEFENIDYEPKYTHSLFSIDFTVSIITNNQCYSDLCDALPIEFGYVTVTDNGTTTQVLCGGTYTCVGATCADATVKNSDLTYNTTVASGGTLTTPDITVNIDNSVVNYYSNIFPSVKDITVTLDDTQYDIYVDGVFDSTVYLPALQDDTITINAV